MKKVNQTKLWLTIGVLVVIIVLVSTFYTKEENGQETKIGAIVFLTGPQSSLGEEVKNAFILANEKYEHVEIILEDSQDDPKVAISAYNKLKLQDIDYFISTGDQVSFALSPIINENQDILLMTVAASQEITGEYTFRGWLTAKQQADVMAEYAVSELNINKVGLIYINNVYGQSYKEAFEETYFKEGGEVIADEKYNIDSMDVKTQILKIMDKQPEAIVVAGFGPAYPLVFKQLRELGWDKSILTDNTLSIPYFYNSVGLENLDQTYFTSTLFDVDSPQNKDMADFIESYKQRFSSEPSFTVAFAFDSFNILVKTLDTCDKKDSDSIKICLEDSKEKGILGDIDFTENHEMNVPILIRKIEDKSFITLQEN